MKGQFTIYAIMMSFIAIVVLVSLLPVLNTFITGFVACSSDSATNSVVSLYPLFMAIGIIAAMIFYFMPQRQVVGQ